jgi:hypothetical protein
MSAKENVILLISIHKAYVENKLNYWYAEMQITKCIKNIKLARFQNIIQYN